MYPIDGRDPMPEPTLHERLRTLAESGDSDRETSAALAGAADELERLARPAPAPHTLAEQLIGRVEHGDHDPGVRALMRDAADTLTDLAHLTRRLQRELAAAERGRDYYSGELAKPLEREAHPLHVVGAELAAIAGVPAPMPGGALPVARRFAASFTDSGRAFPTPAPGSFVFCGPALAVWRVLSVEPLEGDTRGTHALELEAVDAHDVPMLARIAEVPLPITELEPVVVEGGGS